MWPLVNVPRSLSFFEPDEAEGDEWKPKSEPESEEIDDEWDDPSFVLKEEEEEEEEDSEVSMEDETARHAHEVPITAGSRSSSRAMLKPRALEDRGGGRQCPRSEQVPA
ncbi:Hypothetical predicted protein [Xyrichtys novacula]|uniref:Uncharacterized protein n=1 Tax=Xyrichtys novacula TaxID=13765 RepID=A0AAV1FSS4_XYRNO|nr:Hypothetical predicted protein [Xyrichtys novacula]